MGDVKSPNVDGNYAMYKAGWAAEPKSFSRPTPFKFQQGYSSERLKASGLGDVTKKTPVNPHKGR